MKELPMTPFEKKLMQQMAFCDMPTELFPLTIEAFHPESKSIVWTTTVEQPPPGEKNSVYIPPLRETLGHPVSIRLRFGNGEVHEADPIY